MARHGLPFDFPDDVKKEAAKIDTTVTLEEGRRDYRDRQLITIDSEDAKDLDDAIDVVRLPNGHFRLGVYIADVSYYVRPGSAIDQEAYNRGTSVYLVDRVIPMLPTVLSNGICSLNANEDRYSMTCVMEIDEEGKVLKADIGPAVIRVKRRCNYVEIRKALLEGIVPDDLQPFMPMLHELRACRRSSRTCVSAAGPSTSISLNTKSSSIRTAYRCVWKNGNGPLPNRSSKKACSLPMKP